VLLSMFIYTIANAAQDSAATVQTIIGEENTVIPVCVNIEKIEDFVELFKTVNQYLHNHAADTAGSYLIQDISKTIINKDEYSIAPIIYKNGLVSEKVNLFKVYDIALEISEGADKIALQWEYNAGRLKGNKQEELFEMYLKSIRFILGRHE